jgi:ricin-type beta-trefoil lectin protein/putative Ig domain-containing protein
LRFRLYATAGACLTVAAFAFPGLANASPTVAATGSSVRPATAPVTSAQPATLPSGAQEACPKPSGPMQEQCQSFIFTRTMKRPGGATPADANEPLTPADLQSAYGIAGTSGAAATKGSGETVAIVDAYGDPTINTDLGKYRTANNLSACNTANGCLHVFNENGGTSLPAAPTGNNLGWEDETALDTEMVSAICPNCSIDLFEANSSGTVDLGTAENAAAAKGDKFISNSWSGADLPGESALDAEYFNHPGVAITFASGDFGYGASYPASSQFVTSVGGTYLTGGGSSAWTQSVWNDANGATASGCSAGEPKPAWQTDGGCANRTQNDVSAVADSPDGIEIYSSASDCNDLATGECATGGTSAATPIIAAMYALAGTPAANTYPVSYLYQNPSDLTHVTSGNDGTCESNRLYLCNAADSLSNGYNGPTGLGTPNGSLTPFTNSATGDVVSLSNPGPYDLQRGVNVTLPAVKAIDSASGQTLTYSATGLPTGLSLNSSTGVISGNVVNVENDTVHVTATDSTGASATVSFGIEASNSMTASYHAGTGQVKVDVGGKCMDDTGNSSNNGTKTQIWQCTSGDAGQVWSFQPDTAPDEYNNYGLSQTGTIRIHGKCLNIVNNGTTNGSKIQLWSCNGGANEEWAIAGQYGELYNPVSGKCLEDPGSSTKNGTQLDIWTCNLGNNQNWLLPASPFDSAISSMCINDAGNSAANGAKIISYTCNGGSNEKLQIPTAGPYALLEVNGKCLNATGNGTNNGTAIQLYTCADSSGDVYSANLWYLTANGQIENAQAQKCLAIPGNSTANSTRLELEDCYGEPGEVWATS